MPWIIATVPWASLGTLLVTALAVMGSPGPATISLTAAGAAYGIRRSAAYLLGVAGGTFAVLVAVATGVTATLLAVPSLHVVLLALSAAYILRLAYRVATAPPLQAEIRTGSAPTLLGGATLGVANPKAWVGIAAVYTSARLSDAATTDAAMKIPLLGLLLLFFMTVWLIAGASFATLLRDERRARTVNVTLAIALVAATGLALVH